MHILCYIRDYTLHRILKPFKLGSAYNDIYFLDANIDQDKKINKKNILPTNPELYVQVMPRLPNKRRPIIHILI